ncbi:DUF6769 family protein [Bacteroides sp.]|uniref:DUF6769 family protein n=1 Tax=Bacteroides sp. TaxID=29523 RepID=UPI0025C5D4B5|nr:DUF6769 family protein [Bacteroides sp.]
MKRYLIISILAISTFFMLVLKVVPHHHHAGIACIIIELCEDDDAYNDEHTHHEKTSEQNTHDNSCITEIDVIVPASDNEIIYKILSAKDHLDLSVLFILPVQLLSTLTESASSDKDYGEYILHYQSAHLNRLNGLRAPPYLSA